jgi:hypothetical protein
MKERNAGIIDCSTVEGCASVEPISPRAMYVLCIHRNQMRGSVKRTTRRAITQVFDCTDRWSHRLGTLRFVHTGKLCCSYEKKLVTLLANSSLLMYVASERNIELTLP